RLHHPDAVASLDGQPRRLQRLVGGDTAAYAEEQSGYRLLPFAARQAGRAPHRSRLPVVVLELALSDLLQGDRQVVLRARVDHRRRKLVEGPLAQIVV